MLVLLDSLNKSKTPVGTSSNQRSYLCNDSSKARYRVCRHKRSQYSNNPAKICYQAVCHLFKDLALTKSRGIHYWRKHPVPGLPIIPAEEPCISHLEILNKIPKTKQPHRIHAFVNSDWGSDHTHRHLVTGLVVMLAGGVIGYKSKYQPTIALSLTEAEFTAASEAGKTILYICDQSSTSWDSPNICSQLCSKTTAKH
jgi:hypothetical protein